MTDTTIALLQRRLDEVHARYTFRFAGKSRATRSVTEIEQIAAEAEKVRVEASKLGASFGVVVTAAKERVDLYKSERAKIVEVQGQGPTLVTAARLGARANLAFGLYRRHFAGKGRSTRDLALLDEIIEELRAVSSELRSLLSTPGGPLAEEHLGTVDRSIETYVSEHEAIVAAKGTLSDEEKAGMLANTANDQFTNYRRNFAGQARTSRRPQLLTRINSQLAIIEQQMERAIADGEALETNSGNLNIVRDRLGAYRTEADAVDDARSRASVFELIDALGLSANKEFELYAANFAGQDRKTRDVGMLADISDRLYELHIQMRSIASSLDNTMNAQNLGVVEDTLLTYQQEYVRISEAQAEAQGNA
ncbi:MAG: hypothetical protein ACI81R_000050 [Bradymonadia bacterium]|jgi:hypothetical protein